MESARAPSVRYHSLDALRGGMMLLGIWLHAVVAYSIHGGWPWKDRSTTAAFDWTLGLIHSFRMPAFYLLAGFFSALLVERRGLGGFSRNRAVRILIPFAAGWLILFPLEVVLVIAASNLGKPDIAQRIADAFLSGAILRRAHPMHLWFLEYLLLFYAIALLARATLARLPGALDRTDRAFRAIFCSPWRLVPFAALTFPVLCLMENGWLDDPGGFAPEPKIVLAYLVFFGAGWLLHRNADLLQRLARRPMALASVFLGVLAVGLAFACHDIRMASYEGRIVIPAFLGCAGLHALGMWLLTFGLLGVFLRLLERPIPWIRYLSDSSYWLYLVHPPVFLAIQIALARTGWPAMAKMAVVLGASIPILLTSYHVLVRPTWIGVILNGRRYPIVRGTPPIECPEPAAASKE